MAKIADAETPTRGRGRPRLDPAQETIKFTFRILPSTYDVLCHAADARQVKVGEVIRSVLDRWAASQAKSIRRNGRAK